MTNVKENQHKSRNTSSCLVIGGGISGLIASHVLQRNGLDATILDKGRGIGGRLATRRVNFPEHGQGIFDYGVQNFSATDTEFKKLVDIWIQDGLVVQWSNVIYTAEGNFQNSEEILYRGVKSNRNIAKYLAKDLDIRTQTRIVDLQWSSGQWIANSHQGDSFQGDTLLVTAPVPQSLELLNNSDIKIPLEMQTNLEKLAYHRCIAVLAFLDKPSQIPETGGLRLDREPLAWIGCNYKKGISPEAYAVTLHASSEFSLANWDADRDIVAQQLIDVAQHWLGSKVVKYQVHGWKFSQPITSYGQPYAVLKKPGTLVLAGDTFSSQKNLEGAVLSGLAAAEFIVDSQD
ncbi:MAG: FAD-dependent oxidoreductase [Cyanobacteria bacterium J06621_8]